MKHIFVCLTILVFTVSCTTTTSTPVQEMPVEPTDAPTALPTETAAPPEPITLTMNSSNLTSFAPIFIAQKEGFFADEGITLEFVPFARTTDALPLIITGDLDIYAAGVSTGLLNVLGQEDSIKVVASRGSISADDPCVYQGLVVRKDLFESGEITEASDLKGRTLIASTSGPSGYFLARYLESGGLTFGDVTLVDVQSPAYVDSIINKTVDGIVTPELNLSRVMNSGEVVLLASAGEVLGTFQSSILVFGKNLLVENRDAGVRFMSAYLRGVQQYNEGKTDRNVAILAEFTGETEDTLRNACWVSISDDAAIDFAGVQDFQDWGLEIGDIDKLLTEDQFWDPSLLEQALVP